MATDVAMITTDIINLMVTLFSIIAVVDNRATQDTF